MVYPGITPAREMQVRLLLETRLPQDRDEAEPGARDRSRRWVRVSCGRRSVHEGPFESQRLPVRLRFGRASEKESSVAFSKSGSTLRWREMATQGSRSRSGI